MLAGCPPRRDSAVAAVAVVVVGAAAAAVGVGVAALVVGAVGDVVAAGDEGSLAPGAARATFESAQPKQHSSQHSRI